MGTIHDLTTHFQNAFTELQKFKDIQEPMVKNTCFQGTIKRPIKFKDFKDKWPPCNVCRTGVGNNSIFCSGCDHWVHKKYSDIAGPLKRDLDHLCRRYKGYARPIDARPQTKWTLDSGNMIDAVDYFCYLGDTIDAGGSCNTNIVAKIRSAWGKFRELLPLLSSRGLTLENSGQDL